MSSAEAYCRQLHDRVAALGPADLAAIAAFEGGEDFHDVVARLPGCTLKDVAVQSVGAQNPPFTCIVEGLLPAEPLFTGPDFLGLVNEQSPFPESYPGRARAADNPASGSLVHLLIVPTSRIYNAVSLRPAHVPLLLAMRARALEVLCTEVSPELEALTRGALVRKLRTLHLPENELLAFEAEFDQRLVAFRTSKEAVEWGFFLHVHPDHTVGHLHLHCIPLNPSMRTNLVHDEKAVPLDVVISFLTDYSCAEH